MSSVEKLFEPINHESVVDSVVEQIEDLIISGILKEGTTLPSERDISVRMGVSRPKVREALKHLEANKLIVIKHGEKSYIAPLITAAMTPALMNLISRNQSAFYDYLEYRKQQEGFAAELAAERATAIDMERIKELMDQLEQAHINDDAEASKKADIEFHSAIVDASHNSMFVHMMGSIYSLTKKGVFYNRDYLRSVDGAREILFTQHQAIANAILCRQPDLAKQAALTHITFVEETFRSSQTLLRRDVVSQKRQMVHSVDT